VFYLFLNAHLICTTNIWCRATIILIFCDSVSSSIKQIRTVLAHRIAVRVKWISTCASTRSASTAGKCPVTVSQQQWQQQPSISIISPLHLMRLRFTVVKYLVQILVYLTIESKPLNSMITGVNNISIIINM